jgi:hypothetical protein
LERNGDTSFYNVLLLRVFRIVTQMGLANCTPALLMKELPYVDRHLSKSLPTGQGGKSLPLD